MTFREDSVQDFTSLFEGVAEQIRSFPGCQELVLLADADSDRPTTFTTYSVWDSSERLEEYRKSQLFRETWRRTKAMFAGPPAAQSYAIIRTKAAPSGTDGASRSFA